MATRLQAEQALARPLNGLLNFVFQRMPTVTGLPTLDPTPTGTTALYNDAIGQALAQCGYPPADPASVTSGDVAALPAGSWYTFRDLGVYHLIQAALGSYTLTDVEAQDGKEDWATLRKQFADLAATIAARYPALLGPKSGGYLFSGAQYPARDLWGWDDPDGIQRWGA